MPTTIDNGSTGKIVLYCVLSSDHITPATGKTIAVTISKNAVAFGNPSGGATNATEIGSGWYYFTPSGTDTGTNGPLIVLGTNAATDDSTRDYVVAAAATSAPTAAAIATAVWQDATAGDFTVSSSIGKSLYTSGVAPGSSGGLLKIGTSPLPATGTLAAATWDEINTGATHNITNSTGKQLRSITSGSTDAIYPLSGTVNLTAATSTTATLDASASAVSQAYQWDVLNVLSGTGAGQSRIITNYTTGRVATVSPAFTTTPDATSTFDITPTASVQVVSYIAGQDPATLVWAAATRTITGGAVASVTGNVGGNVVGTIGGFTAAALAEFFTLNTTKVYTDAIAGSVVKETASNSGGGGTVDAHIVSSAINVPAILADGVAHGGTPGSSTATLAMQQINATNPSGTALTTHSTGGDGHGWDSLGNGTGHASFMTGGATNSAAVRNQGGGSTGSAIENFGGGVTTGTWIGYGAGTINVGSVGGDGMDCYGGNGNDSRASVGIISQGTGGGTGFYIAGGATGDGLVAFSGDFGGNGCRFRGHSTGKGFLLAGAAATDAFGIAAGAGSPIDVFDTAARVLGRFDATGLAELFTIDSTKVYADAVDGSPVKEIGRQAGGGGTVDAHVVSYASGEDPATLLLASPANKLATDSSGRVTGSATLLDATPTTDPGGVASTFPQMLVQMWRYCFKRKTKTVSGLTIKTYADDNTTVRTTQSYTDDGAGNQTQGPAA